MGAARPRFREEHTRSHLRITPRENLEMRGCGRRIRFRCAHDALMFPPPCSGRVTARLCGQTERHPVVHPAAVVTDPIGWEPGLDQLLDSSR